MACRNSRAPQVIAYWLTSASMAAFAASFSSGGHEKSGKPCERLMPPCARHRRVISRMTDSVKVSALALTRGAPMLTAPSCRSAACSVLPVGELLGGESTDDVAVGVDLDPLAQHRRRR